MKKHTVKEQAVFKQRARPTWAQTPTLSLTGCEILSNSFKLSESWFLYPENKDDNI